MSVRRPPGRVLGIDLGQRRIGLAISDPDRRVATPDRVIARTRDAERDRRAIAAVADEWEASLVVVGLPLSLDGSDGPAAVAARAEATRIGEVTGRPVETYDERFTTVTAERTLAEQDVRGQDRRKVVDMVAAAVLLQAWLDRRTPQDLTP
ncbi:MAG: Holliday junction resolvase RuvX [Acidimicrobiales bacterium]|nr:Holliday junction resolvase RuvX [Acidimicrobiales bacterium]MCB9371294.1 Holliday junction resolvase RuvX [Microthrixaceae bacterium]